MAPAPVPIRNVIQRPTVSRMSPCRRVARNPCLLEPTGLSGRSSFCMIPRARYAVSLANIAQMRERRGRKPSTLFPEPDTRPAKVRDFNPRCQNNHLQYYELGPRSCRWNEREADLRPCCEQQERVRSGPVRIMHCAFAERIPLQQRIFIHTQSPMPGLGATCQIDGLSRECFREPD